MACQKLSLVVNSKQTSIRSNCGHEQHYTPCYILLVLLIGAADSKMATVEAVACKVEAVACKVDDMKDGE